jgi:hypothetical protein
VVKCLRGLPVEELLAVTQQFPRWKPVLDGALGASLAVMPVDQLTALLTGQYKAHNLLPQSFRSNFSCVQNKTNAMHLKLHFYFPNETTVTWQKGTVQNAKKTCFIVYLADRAETIIVVPASLFKCLY